MNARLTKGRHIVDGDDATGAYRYEIVTETGEVTGQWSPPVNKPKPPRAKGNGQARCLSLEKFIRNTEIVGGCCGNEQAEVWGCKVFGECTLSEMVPGIPACCNGCGRKTTERSSLNPIVLASHLSPGDITVMTAAVRDLAKAHPGEYKIHVATSCKEIWDNNPYVTHVADLENNEDDKFTRYDIHYPLINQSNQRPCHFIDGYREDMERQMGITIPPGPFKGDIHISDEEKGWVNQVEQVFGWKGPFWIINAGSKQDFTAKYWRYSQEVVDHFKNRIQFVQCGEEDHHHPPLNGVLDLVGKTNLREFIRLVYHSAGVLCPVTFAMHLAAAVPTKDGSLRPCVVVAGGREPAHWEQYPGHQFLHTIGALPCCATGGCWKSRCQEMGDGDEKDNDTCERPVYHGDDEWATAFCMELITPGTVIDAIERYLAN